MSYRIYIEYGYGIDFTELPITSDAQKFWKFIEEFAPNKANELKTEFKEKLEKIDEIDDYGELDEFGLAGIVCGVLDEYTGLDFTIATDYDDNKFILYSPRYPWQIKNREQKLKEEDLDNAFSIIENILEGSTSINPAYQEVENGG